MRVLKTGLIGFGVVGQGFIRVLNKYINIFRGRYRVDIKVLYIIDPVKGSVYSGEGLELGMILKYIDRDGSLKAHPKYLDIDSYRAIYDDDIDLVIEVTPTNLVDGEPGYSHIREALNNGKHVITSNKGPIALYYNELNNLAEEENLYLGFEGTVMSGTPLIKMLRYGFITDIKVLRGILNGTTNYILSRMKEGYSMDEALKEAQRRGYAEADPSMDIDGYDLVAKATILANLVLDGGLKPGDISRFSLRKYIDENGYRNHLKYIVELDFENSIYSVKPVQLEPFDPLNRVYGVGNGVSLVTYTLNEVFLSGPGAGGLETGYAILTDIIDLIHRYL